MSLNPEQIAALERINYEANQQVAQVTPGLDVILRDDVVLSHSSLFPSPDTNHACLLNAAPDTAEALLNEVVDFYQSRQSPVTIFLSPACAPADLPKRLKKRGFKRDKAKETWMSLKLTELKNPPLTDKLVIREIGKKEAPLFSETFMAAFEMPAEHAPAMAQLLEPSVGLPALHHYLGFVDDQPVATFTLLCHKTYGIIGSAGVVPGYRGTRIASTIAFNTKQAAEKHGVHTLILQTTLGVLLERFLGLHGFKKAFVRESYSLS